MFQYAFHSEFFIQWSHDFPERFCCLVNNAGKGYHVNYTAQVTVLRMGKCKTERRKGFSSACGDIELINSLRDLGPGKALMVYLTP